VRERLEKMDRRKRTIVLSVLSAVIMGLLIWIVHALGVPNPNIILITALVVFTGAGGLLPGGIAGVMMILYSMYFFSEDHSFVRFSDINAEKMWIVILGVALCWLCVGMMKRRQESNLLQIRQQQESLDGLRAEKRAAEETRKAYERAQSDSLTYEAFVQALSADYEHLYYVNLKTERFVEYRRGAGTENGMDVERKARNFFAASRRDAAAVLHEDDRERFIENFTKENVIRQLDEQGAFVLNYRQIENGNPVNLRLRATRMAGDPDHVVIGVSNIDAEVKQEEAAERVREEREAYARVMALTGDFVCIYTVDPETDRFLEYIAGSDMNELGIAKEGEQFFETSRSNAPKIIWPEDLERFLSLFTKARVMHAIKRSGMFTLRYRMKIRENPVFVTMKAALVHEKDGDRLIVGVNNIDAQVQREQEYESSLEEAREKANRDALTGVKNKNAWNEAMAELNGEIAQGGKPEFALIMFDLNELKQVNDSKGHQAGDLYLQQTGEIICDLFKHSPVFRVGGDEFTAITRGKDYENLDERLKQLDEMNRRNRGTPLPIIAAGAARYAGESDAEEVLAKADAVMYENKKAMKAETGQKD